MQVFVSHLDSHSISFIQSASQFVIPHAVNRPRSPTISDTVNQFISFSQPSSLFIYISYTYKSIIHIFQFISVNQLASLFI